MRLYQEGDELAFEILYERYSGKVYGFIKRRIRGAEVADDIFQAVFTKLHKARESYDPTYPFAPWLFTVCRTTLVDQVRKRARNLETAFGEELEHTRAPDEIERPVEVPDLAVLGATQREAIELRYFGEHSFEEIAAHMNTSQANVRQLVSRGIRRLQSLMVKDGEKNERQ